MGPLRPGVDAPPGRRGPGRMRGDAPEGFRDASPAWLEIVTDYGG